MSFEHNKIVKGKYFGNSHINTSFEYYHPTCGWFCNPYELMTRLKYQNIEYRQIPGFHRYYVAESGQVLSICGSGARLLTTQYLRHVNGKSYGPIARIKSDTGGCFTRSLTKIVREVWEAA
jgi:hypothetical protein